MADSRRKTPAKKEPEKKEPEAQAPEEGPVLVHPLNPQAFQFVMQIIDKAEIRGSDAGNIVQLRMELARVANVQTRPRQ